MKNIFLLSCFVVAAIGANAQTPKLIWAKRIGAVANDYGTTITTDASGNVYTTGAFVGTVDFDPGPGTVNLTSKSFNTFITKLDASGNLVWAKSLGGTSSQGFSLVLDASGNIYTTGYLSGTGDFDPGSGTYNLISTAESKDIFISKLNASGDFVWAKLMGGTSYDEANAIAVDASGNVYTCGAFADTVDFDPGPGTFKLTAIGYIDIFISKLDAAGKFVWAKGIGGALSDNRAFSIVTDGTGNVIVTAPFVGTVDSDPGAGTFNLTSAGSSDVLIVKLNSAGNFVWGKQIGGTGADFGRVKTDGVGNIYITGYFSDTVDFDTGAATNNLTSAGGLDGFICKLDASGNFLWAKSMGGTLDDIGGALVLDASGNIYAIGSFKGTTDFDPGAASFNLTSSGDYDIYISKLDGSGNFVWASQIGGTLADYGMSIAVDASGNVYTTGRFAGTADFDPRTGVLNLTSAGSNDIFISKMSQSSVGILEKVNPRYLTIYPNPTNGIINLELGIGNDGDIEIQVLNAMGQKVMEEKAKHSQFNIQHLTAGLYFVKVISENRIIGTQKLMKQ